MPSSLDAFSQGCLLDVFTILSLPQKLHRGIEAVPPGHLLGALKKMMFLNTLLDRLLVDFPSQLGSQNPPKLAKNRCQDAFPS